jgi:CheY-like chemotaxis protein
MLVDDEESVRDFARQVLERFGYTVLTAADGEEALAAYQNRLGDVDLIVLDIGMPGMGGYRCLVELKRVDPSARILVASGYSADAQVREVLEAGATAYVGKPYQVFDLLESVRSALDA